MHRCLSRLALLALILRALPAAAAPEPPRPCEAAILAAEREANLPPRLLAAFRARLAPAEARTWLADVALEPEADGWVLRVPTAFAASWIRSHYAAALEAASAACGLPEPPRIAGKADPA